MFRNLAQARTGCLRAHDHSTIAGFGSIAKGGTR
jgi:hypothetical protein